MSERRSRLRRARKRLLGAGRALAQSAFAAGLAWFLATAVFGYEQPFFAPAAAVVTIGMTQGRQGRRAVEMAIGVAVGIAVADLIILTIGTGAWQIGVVVGLAMGAAVLLGGGPLLVNQAAISAILVATIQPPTGDLTPHRFFHTLIGAAVALLVSQVILPLRPLPIVVRAAGPVFEGLGAALDRTAHALATGDRREAEGALLDARAMDPQVRDLYEALSVANETARLAPTRRATREQLTVYADAVRQVDLAVRNTRVLARASLAVLRHSGEADRRRATWEAVAEAVTDLARGVRALGAQLTNGDGPDDTRRFALKAAARTSALFPDAGALAIGRVVGQVRSTAIDLLRSSGMDLETAQRILDEHTARPEDGSGERERLEE